MTEAEDTVYWKLAEPGQPVSLGFVTSPRGEPRQPLPPGARIITAAQHAAEAAEHARRAQADHDAHEAAAQQLHTDSVIARQAAAEQLANLGLTPEAISAVLGGGGTGA